LEKPAGVNRRVHPGGLYPSENTMNASAPWLCSSWRVSSGFQQRREGVGEGTQTIFTIASPLAFRNAITARPVGT